MTHQYDQSADTQLVEHHRYVQLYELPDYVKTADFQDTCRPEGLPANKYADPREPLQLPCHTKEATYWSWIYFLNHRAEINPNVVEKIAARLEAFTDGHGIRHAVTRLQEKHAQLQQGELGELPDSDFAYVWADELGGKERRYPLRNALEVKAAAVWFDKYRDEFGYPDRRVLADKILNKAARFGADLGEHDQMLQRHAARGFCHPTQAAELIRERIKLSCAPQDLKLQMGTLADAVAKTSELAMDAQGLDKLAATIDQFDHQPGNEYHGQVARIEDVLYGLTYSEANRFQKVACTLVTGSVYTQDQFSKLALADFRDLFGDELAEAVTTGIALDPEKMAEVAFTLPRPQAEKLEHLLSESGVHPVTKQASVKPKGFSYDTLQRVSR